MSLSPDGAVTELLAVQESIGPKLAVGPDGVLILAGGRIPRLDRIEANGTTTLIAGSDDAATEPEVTITSVVVLAVALGSWFGLGAVRSTDIGPLSDLVQGALAMITVSAFEALVFGLLPIHGMPGRVLFKQRRLLWAIVWGMSVLAFFHVLVNHSPDTLSTPRSSRW